MYTLATYILDNVRVGEILRALKEEFGYTYEYIAEHTGIALTTVKNIFRGYCGLTFERAFKFCILFKLPLVSFGALLVKGVPIDFAPGILTYDPVTGGTAPITDEQVNPVEDIFPKQVVTAALSVPEAPPIHHDDHHNQHHQEQSYQSHIEDLRAEITRQEATIRQLLDILAKR